MALSSSLIRAITRDSLIKQNHSWEKNFTNTFSQVETKANTAVFTSPTMLGEKRKKIY